MGASKYSNVWKNCATCAHWAGTREASQDGMFVFVDSSAVGVCNGFWQGSRKYVNDKCTEWALWQEMIKEQPDEFYRT
jgi:hypothetical protein